MASRTSSAKKTSPKKIVKRKSISDLQYSKSYNNSFKTFIKKHPKKIIGGALLTGALGASAISNYYINKKLNKMDPRTKTILDHFLFTLKR